MKSLLFIGPRKSLLLTILFLTVGIVGDRIEAQTLKPFKNDDIIKKAVTHLGGERTKIVDAVEKALTELSGGPELEDQVVAYISGEESGKGGGIVLTYEKSGGHGELVVNHNTPPAPVEVFWHPASSFGLGAGYKKYKAKVFILVSGIREKNEIYTTYLLLPELILPTWKGDVRWVIFENPIHKHWKLAAIIRLVKGVTMGLNSTDEINICKNQDCKRVLEDKEAESNIEE